jgi:hypothetical protein
MFFSTARSALIKGQTEQSTSSFDAHLINKQVFNLRHKSMTE